MASPSAEDILGISGGGSGAPTPESILGTSSSGSHKKKKKKDDDDGILGTLGHVLTQTPTDFKDMAYGIPGGLVQIHRALAEADPTNLRHFGHSDAGKLGAIAKGYGVALKTEGRHPLRNPGNTFVDIVLPFLTAGASTSLRITNAARIAGEAGTAGEIAKAALRNPSVGRTRTITAPSGATGTGHYSRASGALVTQKAADAALMKLAGKGGRTGKFAETRVEKRINKWENRRERVAKAVDDANVTRLATATAKITPVESRALRMAFEKLPVGDRLAADTRRVQEAQGRVGSKPGADNRTVKRLQDREQWGRDALEHLDVDADGTPTLKLDTPEGQRLSHMLDLMHKVYGDRETILKALDIMDDAALQGSKLKIGRYVLGAHWVRPTAARTGRSPSVLAQRKYVEKLQRHFDKLYAREKPGSIITKERRLNHKEAIQHLAELRLAQDTALRKFAEAQFGPADMAEVRYRNRENTRARRQATGKTRSGKWSGASGRKSVLRPTIWEERFARAQELIDEQIAKNPDHPVMQRWQERQAEIDRLERELTPDIEDLFGADPVPTSSISNELTKDAEDALAKITELDRTPGVKDEHYMDLVQSAAREIKWSKFPNKRAAVLDFWQRNLAIRQERAAREVGQTQQKTPKKKPTTIEEKMFAGRSTRLERLGGALGVAKENLATAERRGERFIEPTGVVGAEQLWRQSTPGEGPKRLEQTVPEVPGETLPEILDALGANGHRDTNHLIIPGEDGFPMRAVKKPYTLSPDLDTAEPIEFGFRAISEAEWKGIERNGYMQSDGRMNLSQDEGTVIGLEDPSWYLPGQLASDVDGLYRGRIIKVKLKPEDGWKLDRRDYYVKTPEKVPIESIEAVSPRLAGERATRTTAMGTEIPVMPAFRAETALGDVPEGPSGAPITSTVIPEGAGFAGYPRRAGVMQPKVKVSSTGTLGHTRDAAFRPSMGETIRYGLDEPNVGKVLAARGAAANKLKSMMRTFDRARKSGSPVPRRDDDVFMWDDGEILSQARIHPDIKDFLAEPEKFADAPAEARSRIEQLRGAWLKPDWKLAEDQGEYLRAAAEGRGVFVSRTLLGDLAKPLPSRLEGKLGTIADTTNNIEKSLLIYLKANYVVVQALSNTAMNFIQQGPAAPVNIARAIHLTHADPELAGIVDDVMGSGALVQLAGEAAGTNKIARGSAAMTQRLAHFMGSKVDGPARRSAFLHEADKAGFKTTADVKRLIEDPENAEKLGEVAQRAKEAIVDYGEMSLAEKALIRRIFFVYPWLKGSTKYAGHFLRDHPIQASVLSQMAQSGNREFADWREMLPSYLQGAYPSAGGGGLINPSGVNPLQTPASIAQTIEGLVSGRQSAPEGATFLTPALGTLIGLATKRNTLGIPLKGSLPARLRQLLVEPTFAAQLARAGARTGGLTEDKDDALANAIRATFGSKTTSKSFPNPNDPYWRFFLGGLFGREYDEGALRRAKALEKSEK